MAENQEFQRPINGSFTAIAQTIDITGPDQSTGIVQIQGTWVGTLVIEGCNDGANYSTVIVINLSTGLPVSSITANGKYLVQSNSYEFLQVRSSAWTSGTANLYSFGSDAASLISSLTLLRGATDGNLIGNTGDALKVTGSFSAGTADRSTFTYGATTEQPIGGVYQDTSPGVTAGQTGAVRITQNRALHINLRNDSGVEIGTAATPVRTDPTGTTTQPISGSVSVSNFPADADALAQGSATSGQLGALSMGAVTTAAPTYTTATTNPISLTTAGALRVDGSAVTQPVSGTVTSNQGTSPWITKDQSDGPVTPGAVASFSQLAGGQFNTVLPTLTTTQQSALQLDSSGRLIIAPLTSASITTASEDHNYGTVGANTLRVAAQIGNATGAALFGAGTTTAQVLRVVLPTDQTAIPVTQSTSPWVISGTVTATNPSVGLTAAAPPTSATYIGGSVTTATPTYTTGQMNALSLTTTGLLRVDGSAVTQPISAASLPLPTGAATSALQTTGNTSLSSIDTKLVQLALNYGVATGALRVASQIGNATGAADFNAGATGAQTLRTTSNLATAGTALTSTLIGAKQSLDVNVVNTTPVSTTTGVADKTAFTYGTTLEQPIGGVYQDTSPSLTAGTTGAVRVTQNRGLHVNLRDAAGNEKIGQQTMANSIPVVLPSDQPLDVNVTAEIYSTYTPDFGSYDTGIKGPLNQDASGNLNIRGPVISDEGSLRDDFSGSSLNTTFTGTVTFTNGSAILTGIGTFFTLEAQSGFYVKKTADSETLFLQVDSIDSDTQLTLVAPYAGTTATTTAVIGAWATITGAGASFTQANSIQTIASGTTNGSKSYLYHTIDYLPFNLLFKAAISQRIANQEAFIGMQDNYTTPTQQIGLVFSGTDNTKATFRSSSSAAASDLQETIVTIPSSGLSSAYHTYEVDLTGNQAALLIDGTVVAVHQDHIPQPYTVLGMTAKISNSAAVTNTNLQMDYLYFSNLDQIQITNDFKGEPIPSIMMGKSTTGLPIFLQLDQYGNLIVSPLGGLGSDFAFGDINTAGTTQQAMRRTVYTEQNVNGQRSFASSSALDTAAGTGAQQVIVEYFDQTGAGPFTETVTLNGTTRVNTVATNICFIEGLRVARVGSGGSNAGIITLYTVPTTGGTAIGTIAATDNQTFWSHHYVALGKTCRIAGISGATDLTSSAFVLILLKQRPIGITGAVELQISDSVKLYGGASEAQRNYSSPISVIGPARIVMYATPGSNSSQNVFGSFDFAES